ARVERFMALPDDSRLGHLTNGAVFVQTLSLEREAGNSNSGARIETRLLTRETGQWVGYSYRWNESQTDAALVPATGADRAVVIKEARAPGGKRKHLWRYPSRAECMTCHSRAANFVLGLTDPQLNKMHDYGGSEPDVPVSDNQLRALKHIGVYTGTLPKSS